MRLRFINLLLLACCAIGSVPVANASFASSAVSAAVIYDRAPLGPEVPFPLKADLPFPWRTIEGIWEARTPTFSAYFSFQVQTKCDGQNVLRVYHIEPMNGALIAEGTGLGDDERKMVRAIMSNAKTGEAYMLFIGSFLNRQSIRPKTVTVLTIRSVENVEGDIQMVMRKVSNLPYTSSGLAHQEPRVGSCTRKPVK